MSNSRYFPDTWKSGKAPEKSNFAQTCSLLGQFLKEKGSLRDLNLGTNGNLEALGRPETSRVAVTTTTMNLLSNIEKLGQTSTQDNESSMDFFPQYVSHVDYSTTLEDATIKPSSSKPATMEPKTAQMTIFYAGKVLVFNDFPADKATEVMQLATMGISTPNTSGGFVPTSSTVDKIDLGGNSMASGSNTLSNFGSIHQQADVSQPISQAIGSDLPIARRASLHRFFEKRKDRANARSAPYQVHNPSSTESPKHAEQFDLNL